MPRALDKIQGAEAIDAETQAIADVVKPSENVEDIQEGKATEIASTQDAMSSQELPQRIVLDADLPVENAETKPSSRLKHILIVEDDAQIRQYVHSELSSDFIVSECSNGKDGWDFVQQNSKKVDLIVSDVMMPKMDGVQLCRMVKNNFLTNHIPVILLTAKSDDADRIEGLSIGVDAYITKPFNMEVLRSTITNLLHSRHVLQGKFKTEQKTEEQIDDVEVLSADEHLMERVMKVVNENISNPELNIEFIADKVGVSRVHFHRKIKDLTGQTPGNFLRSIRMTQAAKLLASKHLDITDVSIATGFKSISTFSTSFKQVYGMTPSEYMKRHEEDK
jgi:DNA-binding response OmpR family regulator